MGVSADWLPFVFLYKLKLLLPPSVPIAPFFVLINNAFLLPDLSFHSIKPEKMMRRAIETVYILTIRTERTIGSSCCLVAC
jgi:hypothetical protein